MLNAASVQCVHCKCVMCSVRRGKTIYIEDTAKMHISAAFGWIQPVVDFCSPVGSCNNRNLGESVFYKLSGLYLDP